jgi:hypothetical protein
MEWWEDMVAEAQARHAADMEQARASAEENALPTPLRSSCRSGGAVG